MELIDFIPDTQHILTDLRVTNTKNLFEHLADKVAEQTGLSASVISDALMIREKQGSTALGSGIAIPHARFTWLKKPVVLVAKLATPVDFEAPDHLPVDLVFLLLMPEHAVSEHLKLLARLSRIGKTQGLPERIRATNDKDEIRDLVLADNIRQVA